tara:strand:- start:209 stop:901 length:693 start_codon:yes stop_codon:yes gene_type:complete
MIMTESLIFMKIKKLSIGIVLILVIITGFLANDEFHLYLIENIYHVKKFYSDEPSIFIAIFITSYLIMTALSLPVALLMGLLAGSMFEIYLAIIIVSFTSTVGATVAMSLARYIARDYMFSKYKKYSEIINSNFKDNGGYYLFALRMSPIFPFFVINICFGLTNMKVVPFYLISQIGMLPGTIIIILLGNELNDVWISGNVISPTMIVYLTLLGLIPLLSKKYLKVSKKN